MSRNVRRVIGTPLLAALLLGSLAVPALAAGSPFKGLWVSIDDDGSIQLLSVSSGAEPTVVYEDFYASVCPGPAPKHWVAAGNGEIAGNVLSVTFRKSGCGTFGAGGYTDWYAYDAGADTLTDSYGIVWSRAP